MATVTIALHNVAGTEAALGWAGTHTLVVDRPDGTAGGLGLGFNGAQLLALAIGGCFCNDLRYVAHDMGVAIGSISVVVALNMAGDPLMATAATVDVSCTMDDGSDPAAVIDRAQTSSMVSNSVAQGFPVSIRASG